MIKKLLGLITVFVLCSGFGISSMTGFNSAPGFLPNQTLSAPLEAWYVAGRGITFNGSDYSGWQDQSGNGNDVTQGTASLQPTHTTTDVSLNNQPSADFSADRMVSAAFASALTQPNTIFVVVDADATPSGPDFAIDGLTISTRQAIFVTLTTNLWRGFAGGGALEAVTADANPHILVCEFNTTSSSLFLDGGAAIATGDLGSDSMDGVTLGQSYNGINDWDGKIAEVLVYDGALTTAEQNLVGQYLADKYGTTWTDVT